MKEKITFCESKEITKNVEVIYPFYREHDCGGDNYSTVYYYKIISRNKAYSIKKSYAFWSHEVSFELTMYDKDMLQGSDDINYILGKGIHELSEKEFNEILNEFREYLYNV